jgi:hypothetical protein
MVMIAIPRMIIVAYGKLPQKMNPFKIASQENSRHDIQTRQN